MSNTILFQNLKPEQIKKDGFDKLRQVPDDVAEALGGTAATTSLQDKKISSFFDHNTDFLHELSLIRPSSDEATLYFCRLVQRLAFTSDQSKGVKWGILAPALIAASEFAIGKNPTFVWFCAVSEVGFYKSSAGIVTPEFCEAWVRVANRVATTNCLYRAEMSLSNLVITTNTSVAASVLGVPSVIDVLVKLEPLATDTNSIKFFIKCAWRFSDCPPAMKNFALNPNFAKAWSSVKARADLNNADLKRWSAKFDKELAGALVQTPPTPSSNPTSPTTSSAAAGPCLSCKSLRQQLSVSAQETKSLESRLECAQDTVTKLGSELQMERAFQKEAEAEIVQLKQLIQAQAVKLQQHQQILPQQQNQQQQNQQQPNADQIRLEAENRMLKEQVDDLKQEREKLLTKLLG